MSVTGRAAQLLALYVIALVLLVLLVVAARRQLATLLPVIGGRLSAGVAPSDALVAGDATSAPHDMVVVDTLNLVHATVGAKIRPGDIARVVADSAAVLRRGGHVPVYVIKALAADEDLDPYRRIAHASRVRVVVAVPYAPGLAPPRPCGDTVPAERVAHSTRASDDFLVALMCKKYRAKAVTFDRMSDFGTFRANLAPFRAHEFVWWADEPTVESVVPCSPAYADLRRPAKVPGPELTALRELPRHPTDLKDLPRRGRKPRAGG